jgi:uncharacterized damage-inducible protein DinB
MTETVSALYLRDIPDQLRKLKALADRAVAQVRDEDLTAVLDPESNSLAFLLQHMGGNLRSRFTDFLTSDGEKPDRDRDSEFELQPETTRADLLARWEEGFGILFAALDALTEDDLAKTVAIRAEPHTVVRALDRALTHTAYHVGQIVFLAKHLAAERWQTLSVPRGGTRAFNEKMLGR